MSAATGYIIISVVALALVALLLVWVGRRGRGYRLSPMAGVAFGCIVAGMIFGENRLIGYGLMGVGVVLAVIDAMNRLRRGA